MPTRRLASLSAVALMSLLALLAFGGSSGAVALACSTSSVLSGSNFEIDTDANFKVNGTGDCIDWLAGGTGSALRSGVVTKNDLPTGSGDDSFGQGTDEDNPNPTIVDGSIPPNKSDLKVFGVYTETSASGKFLQLFWTRINSPQGTTNMDFELNQVACDGTAANCANNAPNNKPPVYVTPKRTAGDKLITYDLARGGTVPVISIRTWSGSVWGPATVISGPGGTAIGSVNTSAIAAADSGGVGAQDPITFGEASIAFTVLFPPGGACGVFGSAYLKSRSSDSFPAELKDFIAPQPVQISNCTALITNATASVTIGDPISDTATLSGATSGAGGTITFHLFSDASCTTEITTGLSPVSVSGNGDYNSGNFTPTAVGTYYWTAVYSGDLSNAGSSTACGEPNESSVVNKASPTLPTTPNPSSGTVGVTTLNDSATVSGGFNPTGSIVFSLWDPDQSSCTGTPRFTQTRTMSGGSASTTGGFLVDKAGTWNWTASYGGDDNNDAASSGCTAEAVAIAKATPTLGTTPDPTSGNVGTVLNDSATLTGAFNPTGSITFNLYGPDDDDCNGTPKFTQSPALSGNTASTTGGFTTDAAGTWRWTASYAGDDNNEPASSGCQDEQVTIALIPSTISTAQAFYPNDTATVNGTTANVTFALYGPFGSSATVSCAGSSVFSQEVSQTGGQAATTNYPGGVTTPFAVTAANPGWYGWKVTVPATATHEGRQSNCTERFNIPSPTNDPGDGTLFP